MLFTTKGGDRLIFRAEDTWKFLAEKGKRFYRPPTVSGSGSLMRKFFKSGGGGGGGGIFEEVFDILKPVELILLVSFNEEKVLLLNLASLSEDNDG